MSVKIYQREDEPDKYLVWDDDEAEFIGEFRASAEQIEKIARDMGLKVAKLREVYQPDTAAS